MKEAIGLIWCLFPDRQSALAHAAMPGIEADVVTFRDTSEGVQVGYGQHILGHHPFMAVRAQNLARNHQDLHLLTADGDGYYLLAIRHGIIDPRTDLHGPLEDLEALSRSLAKQGYGPAQDQPPAYRNHQRLRPINIRRLGHYGWRWLALPSMGASLLLIMLPLFEGQDAPAKASLQLGPKHLRAWQAYQTCRDAGRLLPGTARWNCDFQKASAMGPDGTIMPLPKDLTLVHYDHGPNPPVIPGRGLSWEGPILTATSGIDGAAFLERNEIKVTRIAMEAQYPMGITARFFVQ